MARHVLVVEDDPYFSDVIDDVLCTAGYEVTVTMSGFGVSGLVRRPGSAVLADLQEE